MEERQLPDGGGFPRPQRGDMPDVTVYSGNSFPQATTLGRSPGENSAEKGLKSDSPEPDPVRTPGPLHPSGLPQGLTDRRGQRHGSFAFSETDQGGGTAQPLLWWWWGQSPAH